MYFITPISADSNGIWVDAKDIRSGTFGSDESGGTYSFMGDVGIGTATPSAKLAVIGNIEASNIYSNGALVATQNYVDGEITATRNYVDSEISNTISYIDSEIISTRNWVQAQNYQDRVSGTCPSGQSIRIINSDGSVSCEFDSVIDGDSDSTNELQSWSTLPGIPGGFADGVDNMGGVGSVSLSCSKSTTCVEEDWDASGKVKTCTKYLTYVTGCTICVDGICDSG